MITSFNYSRSVVHGLVQSVQTRQNKYFSTPLHLEPGGGAAFEVCIFFYNALCKHPGPSLVFQVFQVSRCFGVSVFRFVSFRFVSV
jgi:hypothetical protein